MNTFQKLHAGVCKGDTNVVDGDHESNVLLERSGDCPDTCDKSEHEAGHVCGTDGRSYKDMCHLSHQACVSGSNLKMLHEGENVIND